MTTNAFNPALQPVAGVSAGPTPATLWDIAREPGPARPAESPIAPDLTCPRCGCAFPPDRLDGVRAHVQRVHSRWADVAMEGSRVVLTGAGLLWLSIGGRGVLARRSA